MVKYSTSNCHLKSLYVNINAPLFRDRLNIIEVAYNAINRLKKLLPNSLAGAFPNNPAAGTVSGNRLQEEGVLFIFRNGYDGLSILKPYYH